MSRGVRSLLNILIVAQAVVLLAPTSIICAVGLLFSATLLARSPANIALWMLVGCVVLMAYSLFSLWWLLFKYRTIHISGIPRSIWSGLTFGVVAALTLSFPHLIAVASGENSVGHSARYIFGFGIGPVIFLVTVLGTVWYRAKHAP